MVVLTVKDLVMRVVAVAVVVHHRQVFTVQLHKVDVQYTDPMVTQDLMVEVVDQEAIHVVEVVLVVPVVEHQVQEVPV
jgi:hypothetical protein